MTGIAKRTMLSDLEIDEVSTVDRPANQHGLIAFAKSLGVGDDNQEDNMSLMSDETVVYDAEGEPLGLDDLEHGDYLKD